MLVFLFKTTFYVVYEWENECLFEYFTTIVRVSDCKNVFVFTYNLLISNCTKKQVSKVNKIARR